MAILKVARMGHPVLRAKAQAVPLAEIGSPRVQRLVDDMFETMREYGGIGLAAPQVHEPLRLFVAGLHPADAGAEMGDEADMPYVTMINPEVTLVGEPTEPGWEGCLSIPDVRGLVPRAHEIRVQFHDRAGKRRAITARGLPARVIQHETDHLDGVLFLDRMPTLQSLSFMDEYRRYWTSEDEDE
jgi:peptide deformylase